jgi:hypothetical protein
MEKTLTPPTSRLGPAPPPTKFRLTPPQHSDKTSTTTPFALFLTYLINQSKQNLMVHFFLALMVKLEIYVTKQRSQKLYASGDRRF